MNVKPKKKASARNLLKKTGRFLSSSSVKGFNLVGISKFFVLNLKSSSILIDLYDQFNKSTLFPLEPRDFNQF